MLDKEEEILNKDIIIDPQVKADLDKASQKPNTITPRSMTSPSGNIKVYIVGTGELLSLSLDNYVKQVLTNEWIASWDIKALRAGALTCKTYGWYNMERTRRPASAYGAHVTDQSASYQRFVKGSDLPQTNNAVNLESGVYLRNSNGECFDATHIRGTPGEAGPAFTGIMSQYGTQYIATTYPEYDIYTIVSYYFSFVNEPLKNLVDGYVEVY